MSNNDISFSISNNNLDFNKIKINSSIYKIELSGTWWKVAISGTGQYQLAIQNSINGRCFISKNYGITWSPTNNSLIGNIRGLAISKDGKYQTYLELNGPINTSSDYGVTWKNIDLCVDKDLSGNLIINNTIKKWYSISISGTGQYQTAVSFDDDVDKGGYIFVTNSYGQSWSDKTPLNQIFPGFYYGVGISYSGKIQLVAITSFGDSKGGSFSSSYIISRDYGNTWTDSVLLGLNLVNCVINQSSDQSIDGKYQYLIDSGGNGIYRSQDFGETWEIVYGNNSDWRTICISDSGQHIYACTRTNFIGISNDYGNTWKNVYLNYALAGISTSSDGSIVTVATFKNKILISTDYGKTFNDTNNSPEYKNINDVQVSSNGSLQAVSIINGKLLISYDYGKNWLEIEQTRTWSQNAISLSGEYQTVVETNGYSYTSSDYGKTWIRGENLQINNISSMSMSGDGKYQIVCKGSVVQPTEPCIYMSHNYGQNWVPIIISTIRRLVSSRMSITGQYIVLFDNLGENFSAGIPYISNDYGMTFNKINISTASINFTGSISSSGQYINIIDELKYHYSTDYGNTFKTIIFNNINSKLNNYIAYKSAMSSNGQYQYIGLNNAIYNIIIYSFDYGNTWQELNTKLIKEPILITSISSNGQYLICSNQNTIYSIFLNTLVQ